MNNAQKHIKSKEQIVKALKALEEAARLVSKTYEYNEKSDVFHDETVNVYNKIITASLMLNEAQQ